MTTKDLKKLQLPDSPGVYLFKKGKEILYVGKATSLKDRVRSYFSADVIATRGPRIVDMVTTATKIEWQETRSVLEALVTEASLIRKYLPVANIKEKDNKSYYFAVLTDDPYPALDLIRERTLEFLKSTEAKKFKNVFGPFPHGTQLRDALKIIRKIFPYRDLKCKPLSGRACFSRQLGLCPGCCTGEIQPSVYSKTIHRLALFLAGKIGTLEKELEHAMKLNSKAKKFEEANLLKKQLFAIQHIRDASIIKSDEISSIGFRIEAYDVAHYSGSKTIGVMTVLIDGWPKKSDYRVFNLSTDHKGNDLSALAELIERRAKHPEWGIASMVVSDGNLQRKITEREFHKAGISVPIVSVVKDEKHKVARMDGNIELIKSKKREIILANSEAHRFAVSTLRNKARRESGLKIKRNK